MTDARLRGEWLNSMRFDALSDTAWRVFTSGLMWSAENGTNGTVPNRYLRMLHPNGEQPDACREIVDAGLGVQEATALVFLDWDGALGQSTAEQVETYKANGRVRARKYRERVRLELAKSVPLVVFEAKATPPLVPGDVPRDVTRDARSNVGKGKGKGSFVGDDLQETNDKTGEVTTSVTTWPTAVPGSGDSTPAKAVESPKSNSPAPMTCRACTNSLTSPANRASGLCRKGDAAHVAARAAA